MSPLRTVLDQLRRLRDGGISTISLPARVLDAPRLQQMPVTGRAALAGLWAGLVCLVGYLAVVLLGWLAGAAGSGSGWEASVFALNLWLFSQGVAMNIGGETISLIPWLLAVVSLLTLRRAAGHVVRELPPTSSDERTAAGMRPDVAHTMGAFVGAYTALAVLVALVARSDASSSVIVLAPFGPAVIAAVAYVWALQRHLGEHFAQAFPRANWHWRVDVPASLRVGLVPACGGVGLLLGLGVLATLVVVALGFSRISVVTAYVDPGLVGGVLLTVAQAAYLLTGALWSIAFAAGPGFTLGQDTLVSWGSAQLSPLPLIPVLGALPDPGDLPGWMYASVLAPICVGAVLGWWSLRRWSQEAPTQPHALGRLVVVVASPAVMAAIVTALIGALCSGALGGQRLAHLGINPFVVAVALGCELVLGAGITLVAWLLRRARLSRVPAPSAPSQHSTPNAGVRGSRATRTSRS